MTQGCLLFAFDSEISYTRFAIESAKRVKEHLGLDITLVTDKDPQNPIFDNVLVVTKQDVENNRFWYDLDKATAWHNVGRCLAYDLSPYDRTLLIDVDYWVGNNSLLSAMNSSHPFLCHRERIYIGEDHPEVEYFGTRGLPMSWATVCVFDKSEYTKTVFDVWKMVELDYPHYAMLYEFAMKPFRNDYALSIALLLANGQDIQDHNALPWPLQNVGFDFKITKADNDSFELTQEKKRLLVKGLDLHVMSKSDLEGLCEDTE